MTHDPKSNSLPRVVADGDALHRKLHKQFAAADHSMCSAIIVELMAFYGQAFHNVDEAIEKPIKPGSLSDDLLNDVIQGERIYRDWLLSNTSTDMELYYPWLAERWERIVMRMLESLG